MTNQQIAVNHKAILSMAGRLEALGFTGDSYEVAERLALNLLADGYRPVDKPVAASGPGASRESIEAAKEAAREAVDAAKRKLTDGRTPCQCGHVGSRHGHERLACTAVDCNCPNFRVDT